MTAVASMIEEISRWGSPRRAVHNGQRIPFLLSCHFLGGPAAPSELAASLADFGLREFWAHSKSADLFKDEKYEQWGIRIFSPQESQDYSSNERARRPNDFRIDDLVFGSFYGDSELLVMEEAKQDREYCPITVAMPIDGRRDWPRAANSFSEFLEKLISAQGAKFWEAR